MAFGGKVVRTQRISPSSPCAASNMAVNWGVGAGSLNGTFAWLSQFRRVRVPYDKRADIHEAFLALGCVLICWRALRKTSAIG
jgi:hypothetical protein